MLIISALAVLFFALTVQFLTYYVPFCDGKVVGPRFPSSGLDDCMEILARELVAGANSCVCKSGFGRVH